jgi:hypothetical protein
MGLEAERNGLLMVVMMMDLHWAPQTEQPMVMKLVSQTVPLMMLMMAAPMVQRMVAKRMAVMM